VSHTVGMWKWLEMTGYFKVPLESEVRRLLDDIRSPEPSTIAAIASENSIDDDDDGRKTAASTATASGISDPVDNSIVCRLQSLLVEEDGDGEAGDEDHNEDEIDFEELYTVSEKADLSNLSLEERSLLHLHNFGLVERLTVPLSQLEESPKSDKDVDAHLFSNGETYAPSAKTIIPAMNGSSSAPNTTTEKTDHLEQGRSEPLRAAATTADNVLTMNGGICGIAPLLTTNPAQDGAAETSELDEVIRAMTASLVGVNEINNRRASFLEIVSTEHCVSWEEQKRKSDEEASLISRCQTLLKKTKEMKAKTGKMAKKADDSIALPW